MLPDAAVFAFRSLEVVSWSVRVDASAGNLEGGFKPDGLRFSIWDGGRSIAPGRDVRRSRRRAVQC